MQGFVISILVTDTQDKMTYIAMVPSHRGFFSVFVVVSPSLRPSEAIVIPAEAHQLRHRWAIGNTISNKIAFQSRAFSCVNNFALVCLFS